MKIGYQEDAMSPQKFDKLITKDSRKSEMVIAGYKMQSTPMKNVL